LRLNKGDLYALNFRRLGRHARKSHQRQNAAYVQCNDEGGKATTLAATHARVFNGVS
jgi:hypothetical protein